MVSSLEKDSTRRGGGGLGLEPPPGNGEKLPGGLGGPLVGAGCIFPGLVGGSVMDKGLLHLRSNPGCPWWVSNEGQAHRKTIPDQSELQLPKGILLRYGAVSLELTEDTNLEDRKKKKDLDLEIFQE